MQTSILGISAFYHDSASAIVQNGKIIACAQEERFTRKKHDPSFPKHAIQYCLKEAGINLEQIDHIVFYDKPLIKFERLLETYLAYAPKGFISFAQAMPVWLKEKLFLKTLLKKNLAKLGNISTKQIPQLLFTQHHQAHAASAFFPSPFEHAAILCLDGVGEWATSSVWLGENNKLTPLWEQDFPHSLGLLYSAFTYYTGFKVNSGEYKLMGLAPYGEPKYVDKILNELVNLKDDGSFRLNMDYFNFPTGLTMTNNKFHNLFGGQPRKKETKITQKEMDIARSIQVVTENIILNIAKAAQTDTNCENLCMAGGVALNCVANGKLLREGPFKNIWVQPAAGDAGGALGAALSVWFEYLQNSRIPQQPDSMNGAYLGPKYDSNEIITYLKSIKASFEVVEKENLSSKVAKLLTQENVIGLMQGKMEFGPRALGNRSIIGDARSPKMQSIMNLKIKYRESFRPFAPIVKADKASLWFNINTTSPYMLLVAPVAQNKCYQQTIEQQNLFGIEKLNVARSQIPAVTHVDYSARVQTVSIDTNKQLYTLLDEFEKLTNCPVLINTSFNVRGEPIVCDYKDAYRCFMRTEMDYLVLENIILSKKQQPSWQENENWQQEFELD